RSRSILPSVSTPQCLGRCHPATPALWIVRGPILWIQALLFHSRRPRRPTAPAASKAMATPTGRSAPVAASWAGTGLGAAFPAGACETVAPATDVGLAAPAADVVNGHTPLRARTT